MEAFVRRQQAGLHEALENKLLTDVTLCVGTEQIHAHRLVLALHSPYFLAMFTNGMKESNMEEVNVDVVDPDTMASIVEYMYSGREILISDTNVWPLLDASDHLQIEELVNACCVKMIMELQVHNCIDIFVCADKFQLRPPCAMLRNIALTFATTFFSIVALTESFRQIPASHVCTILQSDNLCIDDENQVLAAVVSWVAHESSSRVAHLPRLLACIRQNGFTLSKPCWPRQAWYLSRWLSVPPDQVTNYFQSPPTSPRRRIFPIIFALGGTDGQAILKSSEYFDMVSGTWLPFRPMLTRRAYAGSTTFKNCLFILGGHHHRRRNRAVFLKSMEVYSPDTDEWLELPSMMHERSYLGVAVLSTYIYALGGYNGVRHFDCVERYNLDTGHWEHAAPMQTPRSGLNVAVAGNRIFAVGGFDGRDHLSSVEVYDPVANSWQFVSSMSVPRNGAALVSLGDDYLYTFGGEIRKDERVCTGEMYNLALDRWQSSAKLPMSLCGHSAIVWQNQFVFCIGGSSAMEPYQSSVLRFDSVTQSWTRVADMTSPRVGMTVASMASTPLQPLPQSAEPCADPSHRS
ncbi:hypothetical protein LEN26_002738 [Aphanomyces euteiches]|nr:hypothetical protein AeMF1_011918 [Aphanomyces euteiches]KAH9158766.1 hypothetical protein LEN26_002738 [Aphanomyces euteiches]KAH9188463.1 hypothetical protein AeNC1_009559 [Aphanomyces euteiches]